MNFRLKANDKFDYMIFHKMKSSVLKYTCFEGGGLNMKKYACFDEIQSMEEQIFNLLNKKHRNRSSPDNLDLHQLFSDRKRLLNLSCPPSEENFLALRNISNELDSLINLNKKRVFEMAKFISEDNVLRKNKNWNIYTCLIVDGDYGGIELSDDGAYGSDFNRMRPILASAKEIISHKPYNRRLDLFAEEEVAEENLLKDPQLLHWNEPDYPDELRQRWYMENVRGCKWMGQYRTEVSYSLQQLLRYGFWSVPDLLRLSHSTEADIELTIDYSLD